jgi:hypothetical protein
MMLALHRRRGIAQAGQERYAGRRGRAALPLGLQLGQDLARERGALPGRFVEPQELGRVGLLGWLGQQLADSRRGRHVGVDGLLDDWLRIRPVIDAREGDRLRQLGRLDGLRGADRGRGRWGVDPEAESALHGCQGLSMRRRAP